MYNQRKEKKLERGKKKGKEEEKIKTLGLRRKNEENLRQEQKKDWKWTAEKYFKIKSKIIQKGNVRLEREGGFGARRRANTEF